MEKQKIKSVSVAYDCGSQTWVRGQEGVVEIRDVTVEHLDHTEYEILILGENEKKITKIIGGHIIINYE